jgi:hypothetical protein
VGFGLKIFDIYKFIETSEWKKVRRKGYGCLCSR